MMKLKKPMMLPAFVFIASLAGGTAAVEIEEDALWIKAAGDNCLEDPACFNRIHHEIPMYLHAEPGRMIVFEARNTTDFNLNPQVTAEDPRVHDVPGSTVHPLTGPVYIEGAKAGDVLAVKILEVIPGEYGITVILPSGLISDLFPPERYQITWKLGKDWARSDALPGIRIPNAGFPGIVTVLPDEKTTRAILKRERELSEAGAAVSLPQPVNAAPADLCGPGGSRKEECLRTGPPREHGGNFDIRHLAPGAILYLPCRVDGCGLAVGDVHYAQGDGEVAGTAIEMDATVIVRTEIVKDLTLHQGAHYEGPAGLLDIPSRRFYATTGLPFKSAGFTPTHLRYLESRKVAGLENLYSDITLAARNALIEMMHYLMGQKGLTREQAYLVMSVAVDLRIGQVVDAPNVGVSAVLPLDIFVDE